MVTNTGAGQTGSRGVKTKQAAIKADNANARETAREKKKGGRGLRLGKASNSTTGSPTDTAPPEISSKYAKSRPGPPSRS